MPRRFSTSASAMFAALAIVALHLSQVASQANPDPAGSPTDCQLPPVVGECRAALPKFFYNSSSRICEQFIWGGCGGNANRFDSLEVCQRRCGTDVAAAGGTAGNVEGALDMDWREGGGGGGGGGRGGARTNSEPASAEAPALAPAPAAARLKTTTSTASVLFVCGLAVLMLWA